MKRGKIIILFLSVLLLALLLFGATQEEAVEAGHPSLTFAVGSGQNTVEIRCWENEEGAFFVFLPGYAQMEQVFPVLKGTDAAINGISLSENIPCNGYSLNTEYPFTYSSGGKEQESTLTFLRSGGVPSLHVDTSSGSMEYIHREKGNQETGTLRLYDADGQPQYSGKLDIIQGRGNTSWDAPKKPYTLILEQDADLLGMGAARRWILLAEGENGLDIRNKIVYDFAKEVGLPYSPDCEWVDLYLNGEYAGLYLLSEKNEVSPERVDIAAEGSFLISLESERVLQEKQAPYISVGSSQVLRTRYVSMSNEELSQIWITLKNALESPSGIDPVSGKSWQELIDVDSWVKKYLIEEVFANPDGGVVSQFFYLDGGDPSGKIYAGPVWDYDYAMGGEDHWMRNFPSYLFMDREYTENGKYLPWYYGLYHQEAFYQRLQTVFAEEFLPKLKSLTETGMDEYFAKVEKAALTDAVRWGNPPESIYADLEFIRRFMENRMDFLSDLWIAEADYHLVHVDTGLYNDGYFAIRDGQTLPDLTAYTAEGSLGWFDAETGEPFDITQPIYADAFLCAKAAEPSLPVISLLPVAGLLLGLLLWTLLDRYHTKQNGGGKHEPVHTV